MVLAVDYEPMLEMGNMLMIFNNISNAILFGSPFFGLYYMFTLFNHNIKPLKDSVLNVKNDHSLWDC